MDQMRLLLPFLLASARAACPTLQYASYQYLTTAQLSLYNLTACATACTGPR